MAVYSLAFLSTGFLALLWRKYERGEWRTRRFKIRTGEVFRILTFLPMFLVNALMYNVGIDYRSYASTFYALKDGGTSNMEIGFQWINRLVARLGLDFQFVYIICCLIGYTLLAVCTKDYSSNFALTLILYFSCKCFFGLGMLQLRQFIAVMIVFWSYRFIAGKRPVCYVLTVLCAGLFHFTALMMLPMYFIFRIRLKLGHYICLAVIALPVNLAHNQVIYFLYRMIKPGYIGTSYMEQPLVFDTFAAVEVLMVILIIAVYYNRIPRGDVLNPILINSIFTGAFIILFCQWIPQTHRIASYFIYPMVFLVPNLLELEKDWRTRFLLSAAFVGYTAVFITLRGPSGIVQWLPYQSVLFRS